MSIFTKSLSELNTADLQELISDGSVENVRLEFKSEVPNKDETLKKLSSFANTFGGFMVVGAKANSADGRIEDLPGVDAQPGYKQKVVQWSFDAVSPPLMVEVSDPIPAPSGNGKVCYVTYTAESDVAPHFLNGRKGIWARTDEFSSRFEARLADENEVRYLFDRRRLIRDRRAFLIERARKRFESYMGKKNPASNGAATTDSLLTFSVIPRFPARPLCRQEKLKSLILTRDTYMSWRQVMFPDVGVPIISQFESAIMPNFARGTSFLEVNIWELLFYAVQVDSNDMGNRGIHLGQFIGYCLAFIQHSGKLLRAMGYSGPLHMETTLGSIRDVPWLRSNKYGAGLVQQDGSVFDDEIAFLTPRSSEELFEKHDGIAIDILRNILFSVNSSHLVDTQQKLEDLIRVGYDYNFWSEPTSLRI
jgi:hypothetical protein